MPPFFAPVFSLLGVLLISLFTMPTTRAQQPQVQWATFQLDNQVAFQLPALPRLLHDAEVTNQQMQSYMAQSPQVLWAIVRSTLPAKGPIMDQNMSYAGYATAALTHWKAEEVHRSPFRLGSLNGLTMDFRVLNPAAGKPTTGTLWVLRVNRTIYVVQWLAQAAASPDIVAQKQHFLASWTLTHLPATEPTAADFARFHTGQFRAVNSPMPTTVITRTDTVQTEVNTAKNLRIVYSLKWNKVGYDMRQRSSNSPYAALFSPKVFHVRITAVQGNTYWYRTTVDDFISTGQLERIK